MSRRSLSEERVVRAEVVVPGSYGDSAVVHVYEVMPAAGYARVDHVRYMADGRVACLGRRSLSVEAARGAYAHAASEGYCGGVSEYHCSPHAYHGYGAG